MIYIDKLADFIDNSPTAFHAVDNIAKRLESEGFRELSESKPWRLLRGEKYYILRNHSSIIAFKISNNIKNYSFLITASHSDSPCFKLKEKSSISIKDKYTQLNTEGYGGMLCGTWFDRPLSIAGRVIVKKGHDFISKLISFDRDLLIIPSVAIHMNRKANEGYAYNKQIDMLPLISCDSKVDISSMLAKQLDIYKSDIYGSDLFLYNRMPASIWGANREFFSAPRIDNLESAYASLEGFLSADDNQSIQLYSCFDNEEVGSGSKQGAASTFLYDVLHRINLNLGYSEEDFHCAIADSFMLSCDNAHAVHPNHPELTDSINCSYINEGIVIKSHAGQKYTSDGLSIAIFKHICEKAGVPYQFFANRSDKLGGSTLGNISMTQVSLNAIDIGLPQLAMHSSYETAGVQDYKHMIDACKEFYSSNISQMDSDTFRLK